MSDAPGLPETPRSWREASSPGRFVILAFESREAAHAWYDSDEYQAAAEIRKACSDGDVFIIDEVPAGAGPTREWGDRR